LLRHAVAHLRRGLVRERDGEDRAGMDAPLGDEVGDPPGEHARLAGTGGGDDEDRGSGVTAGPALGGVEPGEQRLRVDLSGGPWGAPRPAWARLLLRRVRLEDGEQVGEKGVTHVESPSYPPPSRVRP